jgi:hypothetical protein
MHLVDRPDGTFTTQELERLAVYRAAVDAGFYTDEAGTAPNMESDVLAWLSRGDGAMDGDAYPFTPEERQNLERLKAAVAENVDGRYADDQPPAAAGETQDGADR